MYEKILPPFGHVKIKLDSFSLIILFHVIAPSEHIHAHTIGGLDYIRIPERRLARDNQKAEEYLTETSEKLKDTGVTVRHEIKFGDAAQEIAKFADKKDISLIALSSSRHSSFREWIFESVAHKISQVGITPVFLIKAPKVVKQ